MAQVQIHPRLVRAMNPDPAPTKQLLSAQGLYRRPILQDVSLEIDSGEFVMLMGPSGCGKSTLLRCLAGLDPLSKGTVIVNGTPISHQTRLPAGIHPFLTVVFQQLFLWPHMTNLQNILLSRESQSLHEAKEKVASLSELFEISHILGNHPNESSLGERQRVAILRALVMNPRILLLDEVTSALNSEMTVRVAGCLRQAASAGTAILCITHDAVFAQENGTRLLRMQRGRLTEDQLVR